MTEKITYKKGLWIDNENRVTRYFFFENSNSNINILNEINQISNDLFTVKDLLKKINLVISEEWVEFEVETNMVIFTFMPYLTTIKNYLFDEPIIELSTLTVFDILNDKKTFLEFPNNIILQKIENLIAEIKNNPTKDKYNFLSATLDNDLYVRLDMEIETLKKINFEDYSKKLHMIN